jgi:hypothetical protein
MSLFHFHLADGVGFADDHGTELPGLADARKHALRYAGALIAEASDTIWSKEWSLRVTNGDHLTLFSLMVVATDETIARTR